MRPELRARLTFGPILGALVIAAFIIDFRTDHHYGLLVLVALTVGFGCRELQRMARAVVGPVQILPTVVISYLLLAAGYVRTDPAAREAMRDAAGVVGERLGQAPLVPALLSLGLLWAVLIQMKRRGPELFFTNVSLTMFGMLYLGLSTHLVLQLGMLPSSAGYYGDTTSYANRGTQLVLLYIASCKLGDVTAFFGGRAFGRHKMAPSISPGKTWEGFACSYIGAIGGAYLMSAIFSHFCAHGPFNSWWQPAVWGAIIGPLGVVGDLAESCMKRQAERKDSGNALPGFGGFLDLFDAVLLGVPVAYVLAVVL